MAARTALCVIPFLLSASSVSCVPPTCEQDGDFPDDEDCSRYYSCSGGTATSADCPFGLFFSDDKLRCDWPQVVGCQLTESQVRSLRLPEPRYVYLTIDDFPCVNEGADDTLDALLAEDVKVTFFSNFYLLDENSGVGVGVNYTSAQVLRALEEGHAIGDHSLDHMTHNNDPGEWYTIYDDVDDDLSYFGEANFEPLATLMEEAGYGQVDVDARKDYFMNWARMPSSNHWRLGSGIRASCADCAPPASSTVKGMQVGDRLFGDFGTNVLGWDIEFPTDWTTGLYKVDAVRTVMYLLALPTHVKNKVVFVDHCQLHDPDYEDYASNLEQFKLFLSLAKDAGFEFRTLDTYLD